MNLREFCEAMDRAHDALVATAHGALPPEATRGFDFFRLLISQATQTGSQRRLAIGWGIEPCVIISRFWRRPLPSIKTHLIAIRLVYVKALYDVDATTKEVVKALNYSTPSMFSRHVLQYSGWTPLGYRQHATMNQALNRFADLITNNRKRWEGFHPTKEVA